MSAAVKHLEQAWGSEAKDTANDAKLTEYFDGEYLGKNNIDPHQLILKYNLSVVYALRQDFEKAQVSLDQVWNSFKKIPPRVAMVAIYLHLRQGNAKRAQDLALKHLSLLDPPSTLV
ncbi:Tetratricopeptide-like helical domain [Trinorchestia longiramus]|nr:Tetratricopeptide-like helical domain [Trinorchestia longiramus]